MLLLVSSTKTKRRASRAAIASRQAARVTSSRSVATNVFFPRPAQALDGARHRREADAHPVGRLPALTVLDEGGIRMGFQLRPEEPVLFRRNRPRAAGDRFGVDGARFAVLALIPLDGGGAHAEALRHLPVGEVVANGPKDAFAQIKGIGFHGRNLSPRSILSLIAIGNGQHAPATGSPPHYADPLGALGRCRPTVGERVDDLRFIGSNAWALSSFGTWKTCSLRPPIPISDERNL